MKEPLQMAHRISKTGTCPGCSVKDQSQLEFSGSAADALQQDHPVAACSMNSVKSILQGGAPPVVSWFITPIKYRYIYHKPKLLEL